MWIHIIISTDHPHACLDLLSFEGGKEAPCLLLSEPILWLHTPWAISLIVFIPNGLLPGKGQYPSDSFEPLQELMHRSSSFFFF